MKKIKLQLFAIELCAVFLLLGILLVFFQRFQMLAEEKQEIYLRNSLLQAAKGVENVLDDIQNAVNNYAYSEAVQELLRAQRLSSEMLSSYDTAYNNALTIININQNIEGIAIVPLEGIAYSFGLQGQYRYLHRQCEEWRGVENWIGGFEGALDNSWGDQSAYFTYAVPIFSTAQDSNTHFGAYLGTCVAFGKKQSLYEVLEPALLDEMSIELRSSDERILLSQKGLDVQNQTTPQINSYTFQSPNWILIQRDYSAQQSSPYLMFFGVSFVISLGVLAMLSIILHRSFTLPILNMNEELMHIAERPLEAQSLSVHSANELSTIAHSVNTLLDRLRQSHKAQVEQENHMLLVQLSVQRLQLALLQNQINPHFLYNTLACIRGIALSNGVQVIADMVSNMAMLYRYSIKGGAYARIGDELDIVRRYLQIMNLRMENKFSIKLEVPSSLAGNWMAKMILQPLVENAVLHGLECKEKGGYLRIYTTCFEGDHGFMIHVYDNGLGLEPGAVDALNQLFNQPISGKEPEQQDLPVKGMGMLNVHRKVRLLHGEAYGLHVESKQGEYTRVSVLLPILLQQPDETAHPCVSEGGVVQ